MKKTRKLPKINWNSSESSSKLNRVGDEVFLPGSSPPPPLGLSPPDFSCGRLIKEVFFPQEDGSPNSSSRWNFFYGVNNNKVEKEEVISMMNLVEVPPNEEPPPLPKTNSKGRIKILYSVCHILKDAFNNETIDIEGYDLMNHEINYIKHVIETKSRHSNKEAIVREMQFKDNMTTNKAFKELLQTNFSKEKNRYEVDKFVFKITVKLMKESFSKTKSSTLTKEENKAYLEHYFGEKSKLKGVPLSSFTDPYNKGHFQNEDHKGITKHFIKLLFSCTEFYEDFFKTANNRLKEKYQSSVFDKFRKLTKKLRNTMKIKPKEMDEEIVNNYIQEEKKNIRKAVKLPWTDYELSNALKTFKANVNEALQQNKTQ